VLRDNLATHDIGVIAYAGVPLIYPTDTRSGRCVIYSRPRHWTTHQVRVLTSHLSSGASYGAAAGAR
jgi:hypothetical protein